MDSMIFTLEDVIEGDRITSETNYTEMEDMEDDLESVSSTGSSLQTPVCNHFLYDSKINCNCGFNFKLMENLDRVRDVKNSTKENYRLWLETHW